MWPFKNNRGSDDGSMPDQINNLFSDFIEDASKYHTKINRRPSIQKKQKMTLGQLAETLFSFGQTLTERYLSKDDFKKLGIDKVDSEVVEEFLIFHLFVVVKGIECSSISAPLKQSLAETLYKKFLGQIKEWNNDSHIIEVANSRFVQRLKGYQMAYECIFADSTMPAMLQGMDYVFDNLHDILPSSFSKKDIFNLLPLHLFFSYTIMGYAPICADVIDETEIIK